jgi:hypothetical protein
MKKIVLSDADLEALFQSKIYEDKEGGVYFVFVEEDKKTGKKTLWRGPSWKLDDIRSPKTLSKILGNYIVSMPDTENTSSKENAFSRWSFVADCCITALGLLTTCRENRDYVWLKVYYGDDYEDPFPVYKEEELF